MFGGSRKVVDGEYVRFCFHQPVLGSLHSETSFFSLVRLRHDGTFHDFSRAMVGGGQVISFCRVEDLPLVMGLTECSYCPWQHLGHKADRERVLHLSKDRQSDSYFRVNSGKVRKLFKITSE